MSPSPKLIAFKSYTSTLDWTADDIVRQAVRNAKEEHQNVARMQLRAYKMRTTLDLNLNALSDQKYIVRYRFKKYDIGQISNLIYYHRITDRNGYVCDPVRDVCFLYIGLLLLFFGKILKEHKVFLNPSWVKYSGIFLSMFITNLDILLNWDIKLCSREQKYMKTPFTNKGRHRRMFLDSLNAQRSEYADGVVIIHFNDQCIVVINEWHVSYIRL